MSGAASGNRRNLVAWIRLDSNGNIIPGSEQYRPRGVKPKDGIWRQVISSYCCDCYCTITFYNMNTTSSVTSITTADGAIDWTGDLPINGVISFVIPSCYDEAFTVQFGPIADPIIVYANTAQGEGVLNVDNDYLDSGTTVTHITTTATPCSQYFVTFQLAS